MRDDEDLILHWYFLLCGLVVEAYDELAVLQHEFRVQGIVISEFDEPSAIRA